MTGTTTTDAGPGRRERKKQATRKEIKRAALRLALERGAEHLTVDEIAEAGDVSSRTFFNYFSCKEDALVSDNSEAVTALREAIAARPVDEPALRTLRAAFGESGFVATVQEHREDMLARHRLVTDNPALLPRQLAQYAALEQALTAAMAERLGADPERDLRPAVLASLAATVLRVAIHRWSADGSTALEELFHTVFDLLETELR
jgi:AcrR family transcriptional regulator